MLEFKKNLKTFLIFQMMYISFVIINITSILLSSPSIDSNNILDVVTEVILAIWFTYLVMVAVDIFVDSIFNYMKIHTILGISKLFNSSTNIEHKDQGVFRVYLRKIGERYMLEVHKQYNIYTKLVGKARIEKHLSADEIKEVVYSIVENRYIPPIEHKDVNTRNSFKDLN